MVDLFPEKMVTIITASTLEEKLVDIFRSNRTSGYTIVAARGAGSDGVHSGLDFDANILVEVIIPEDRLDQMLQDLKGLMTRGHHLTVFVTDVTVINPKKFTKPWES